MTSRSARTTIAGLALVALTVGCTATGSDSGQVRGASKPTRPSVASVDQALEARVQTNDLAGAADLIVRNGTIVHRAFYGSYTADTVAPIASASKWLTAALIMTLVDDGHLRLDDPVGATLPEWNTGDKTAVTLRQLLSHQAGVPASASCLGDPSFTLRSCASSIAETPLASPPGTRFAYGNAGYTVAAAVAEVAGGAPFAALFRTRIAEPLRLDHTAFHAPDEPLTPNPIPAAGAVSTLDDYGRFVAMMAGNGTTADDRRVLSTTAVTEIERNQVAGLDTSHDAAVQITGFGTYGLGVWRDRAAADDTTRMVSGSGSVGFYPWIDRDLGAYGVVMVDDEHHQDGDAVRASSRLVHDTILAAIAAG